MKKMIGAALVAALLTFPGYICAAADDGPAGKWRGTISENGRDTLVELELRVNGALVEGSLAILTETGQDVEKGMVFPVVRGECAKDRLSIVVAITEGQINDDALAFELQWHGDELEGTIHEMRSGSRRLPVMFTRATEAQKK